MQKRKENIEKYTVRLIVGANDLHKLTPINLSYWVRKWTKSTKAFHVALIIDLLSKLISSLAKKLHQHKSKDEYTFNYQISV